MYPSRIGPRPMNPAAASGNDIDRRSLICARQVERQGKPLDAAACPRWHAIWCEENDHTPMTNQAPISQCPNGLFIGAWSLVIDWSLVIGHSFGQINVVWLSMEEGCP